MESKSNIAAEKLAAFKDGKLSEEEKEAVLAEAAKDPEMFEQLCALEDMRLAEQAGFENPPMDLKQKALAGFSGSIGSKIALFLAGKAVPIAAGVITATAIVFLAVYLVNPPPDKTAQAPQPKADASKTKTKQSARKKGRTSPRASRKNRLKRSVGKRDPSVRPTPRETDPYARFRYKVPKKNWAATRKLLDRQPKDLFAAFKNDETPGEETSFALAIKGKDFVPEIMELAGSGSDRHRSGSFRVLELMAVFGDIEKKNAAELVTLIADRISNDTVQEVKKDAIKALESLKLDKKTTFKALQGGLSDTEPAFRAEVVKKLARYVTQETSLDIVELLTGDPAPEVKVAVIESARFINPKPDQLLEGIANAMQSAADPRVRFSAIKFTKANQRKTEDKDIREKFQDKIFKALVAVAETDAEGTPVKPGAKVARYTKNDVMPDVEVRIEALEMLIRGAVKKNRETASETVARLAGSSSRPALKAAALLKLDKLNPGLAFEMILEAVKAVQIDDQKSNPAFGLYCRKLDSISRQSFGLKPGQAEGDYYAALEKAENWFAENKESLAQEKQE